MSRDALEGEREGRGEKGRERGRERGLVIILGSVVRA